MLLHLKEKTRGKFLVWCYYLVQVWPFQVLLSGPSWFFFTLFVKKHYKNWGFSIIFLKEQLRAKNQVLLSGPSWPFLRRTKLGPDNNNDLDLRITPPNGFFAFLFLKNCRNTYFYCFFFLTSTKLWPKIGPKTITFHILQNTGY